MTHCWVNLFSRPHRIFSRNPLLTAWVLDLVKGASRWVLSRNKRNQPHQLWQQPRGWRWGLLVWDNWCVSYTTIAPLSWPAVSLYAAFWFSASPKAFSAVTTWQPVLCFVGRSSGQTHHGREKQPVIFPHMVLSLDAETSFFETIKVLLDDLIWMISLIIMLQYPSKKLYWNCWWFRNPKANHLLGCFPNPVFIMAFQLPTSTGESRISGCHQRLIHPWKAALPDHGDNKNNVFIRFLEWMEIGCLGWGLELL